MRKVILQEFVTIDGFAADPLEADRVNTYEAWESELFSAPGRARLPHLLDVRPRR